MLTVVASRLTVDRARHLANGGDPEGLVWSKAGKPIAAQRDSTAWRRLLERADVPHVPLHAARNTTGSLLMAAGVPDKLAAEILGHGSIKVTQKHYQQGDSGLRRAAIAQLEAYVSG